MDDARGDFLRPPHGTTPAAVLQWRKVNLKQFLQEQKYHSKTEKHGPFIEVWVSLQYTIFMVL